MANFWNKLRRTFFEFINFNKDKAATHKAEEVGKNAGTARPEVQKPSGQFRKRENVSPAKGGTPAKAKAPFKKQSEKDVVKGKHPASKKSGREYRSGK